MEAYVTETTHNDLILEKSTTQQNIVCNCTSAKELCRLSSSSVAFRSSLIDDLSSSSSAQSSAILYLYATHESIHLDRHLYSIQIYGLVYKERKVNNQSRVSCISLHSSICEYNY